MQLTGDEGQAYPKFRADLGNTSLRAGRWISGLGITTRRSTPYDQVVGKNQGVPSTRR